MSVKTLLKRLLFADGGCAGKLWRRHGRLDAVPDFDNRELLHLFGCSRRSMSMSA